MTHALKMKPNLVPKTNLKLNISLDLWGPQTRKVISYRNFANCYPTRHFLLCFLRGKGEFRGEGTGSFPRTFLRIW
jgi:hypothetical protein